MTVFDKKLLMDAVVRSADNSNDVPMWFAMSATFGRELKAKELLDEEQVQCFVPMRYEVIMHGRHKGTRRLVSVINNLIFVYADRKRIQLLKSKIAFLQYYTHYVDGRNRPVVVPENQMRQFIAVCNTLNDKLLFLSPDEVNLSEGTRVRIAGGTFDGVEGTFVRVEKGRQKKVVVMVEGITAVALAKFTDGYLQPLEGSDNASSAVMSR